MRLNRRNLLKHTLFSAAVIPVVAALSKTTAMAKDKIYKKADLATEKKNPAINALKYVADATKSPLRKTAKMGVPANKQLCDNCNFYRNEGILEGTKDKVGQCTMFANQAVHGKGWCNVWTKKA